MSQELLVGTRLEVDYFTGAKGALHREVVLAGDRKFQHRLFRQGDESQDPWDLWWKSFLNGAPSQFLGGRPRQLRVVDLFCSAGGLSLGVREAARALGFSFDVELAADLDAHALASYAANFSPRHAANASVRSLVNYQVAGQGHNARFLVEPTALAEAAWLGEVNLIVGGPPCQGHSSLNNHTRGDDVRNDLYLTLPSLAIATNADALIIENVPRVIHDKQEVVATSIELLREAGYSVTSGTLSASDLGWPQTRSRHFLIAVRGVEVMPLGDIQSTLRETARSVWWAISDLADEASGDDLMMTVPKLSDENRKRIDWLFENNAYELPNHIRPDCHKDGHTYPAVYGRILKDLPAPTITTGFQTPGRGRFVHPTKRRVLTVREAARIQGFPDTFEFRAESGSLTRAMLQKWIGDAVPSILGFAAGLVALEPLLPTSEA